MFEASRRLYEMGQYNRCRRREHVVVMEEDSPLRKHEVKQRGAGGLTLEEAAS